MSAKTLTEDQFNLLTNAEKRMLIAHDVLEQIKIQRFVPKMGTYFASGDINLRSHVNEDMSKTLAKIDNCHVCAKGACFIAAVERFNKVKITEDNIFSLHHGGLPKEFNDIFDIDMWEDMEDDFENEDFWDDFEIMGDYEDDRLKNISYNRMTKIMLNILWNSGDYIHDNPPPAKFVPNIDHIFKKLEPKTPVLTKIGLWLTGH